MTAMNIRKWICSLTSKGTWIYKVCDCQRYEPAEPDVPDVVYVSVCEGSGLRSGPWCPIIAVKAFIKGQEPTTICTTHKKPEEPVVVPKDIRIACSCYNLLTARGDVGKFITIIAANGATACRFFLIETWGDSTAHPLQPYVEVGRWRNDYHDGPLAPIYDLEKWNEAYWNRLKAVLTFLKEANIRPHLVFFDHSSRNVGGIDKYYEPLFSNIQRYPTWKTDPAADPAIPGGLMGQGMKQYHKKFMNRVVKLVSSIGLKADYEIWNEFYGWHEGSGTWPPVEDAVAWFQEMTDYLVGLGVPEERIITSNSLGAEEMAEMSGVYAIHNIGNAAQIKPSYPYHAHIEFSGDGYYQGQGNADYKGRRCASAEELSGVARKMRQYGYKRYEYFDFAIEGAKAKSTETWCGVWANVDLFDPAPLKAMVNELAKAG